MSLPAKREGLKENLSGSDLFIYDASGEELTVLNQSALFIWSLCEDHDVAAMTKVLAEIYPDAAATELEDDIRICLDSFREKDLVRYDATAS